MDFITTVAISLGIAGVLMAILVQIIMRLGRSKVESKVLSLRTELMAKKTTLETSTELEAIANRVERLETSISLEPAAEELVQSIDNRLRDIEKTLEPLRNGRLEITSTEYQFLMFEIDRLLRNLKEDLTEQQRIYEINLDSRIGTFRTIFMVSLTVVGLIIAGFGVVIWFIGKG